MKKSGLLLCLAFFQCLWISAKDSSKIQVAAGFGFPEIVHLGARLQITPKNQIGLYFGSDLPFNGSVSTSTVTLDHQYHFGHLSAMSSRKVWYFKQGATAIFENSDYAKTRVLTVNLSLGRDMNISKKFSLTADLGFWGVLAEHKEIIDPAEKPWLDLDYSDFSILPLFRLQFCYRL